MVLELLNRITDNMYIHSLIILVVFYGMSQLLVFLSERILLQLTKRTKTNIDDLIVSKANKPISFILILIGLKLAIIPHSLPEYATTLITHIISTLIIILITYIVIVIIDIFIDNWGQNFAAKTESKFDDELVKLFQRFSRVTISFIGLIFILDAWGIKVGPLLASLGIAGIAIAFALQSTLGNIFGGIAMIIDRSVTVGDFLKIEDGTEGTVIDIGLRSTKIRSVDGDLIILPNGKLADSRIYNYHKPMPNTRATIEFGVKYGSDVGKVKNVVLNELKQIKSVLNEPAPQVVFTELGDYALKFKAMFWVRSIEERLATKDAATTAIYNALNKHKIDIPFPIRTIYLKKEK